MSLFELKKVLYNFKDIKTSLKLLISNLDMFMGFIIYCIPERSLNIHGDYFPVCSRCKGFCIGTFSYFIFVYSFYIQYTASLIILNIFMIFTAFLNVYSVKLFQKRVMNLLRLLTDLIGGVGLAML